MCLLPKHMAYRKISKKIALGGGELQEFKINLISVEHNWKTMRTRWPESMYIVKWPKNVVFKLP